jgi:hypothetical protein
MTFRIGFGAPAARDLRLYRSHFRNDTIGFIAKRMHLFAGDWRLIDTAPLDQDVTLLVTDGRGEPRRSE